jgi:hypothetical protein
MGALNLKKSHRCEIGSLNNLKFIINGKLD